MKKLFLVAALASMTFGASAASFDHSVSVGSKWSNYTAQTEGVSNSVTTHTANTTQDGLFTYTDTDVSNSTSVRDDYSGFEQGGRNSTYTSAEVSIGAADFSAFNESGSGWAEGSMDSEQTITTNNSTVETTYQRRLFGSDREIGQDTQTQTGVEHVTVNSNYGSDYEFETTNYGWFE